MNTPARALAGRPWPRAAAWLALLAPVFYVSYGLANHLAAARAEVPSVVFGWEQQIPFWGWTIFPYWSLNAFYGLSLFLATNRRALDRHAARLLTAQAVAVACFIAWPLRFNGPQPDVDGVAGWLFAALRTFDQPFNQAPSLHVALVVILWDLYRRCITAPWARALLHGWSLLIVGSVLTTYQHHFIDVPTGALLGLLCVWAWPLEGRVSMVRAWRFTTDGHRRRLALRYAGGAAACGALAAAGAWAGWPVALVLAWPAVSLALVALNYAGLGARGFQADRQGRMPWAVRVLLAPYRVGASVNARLWTRGLPPVHRVLPTLWLGSLVRLGDRAQPLQGRPQAVLSLCAELPMPRPGQCLPMLDLVPATPARLRAAAGWIEAAHARGEPVVVCCALGFSRSVAAVACWLVRSGRATSVDEALQQIRHIHPRATLGDAWLQALRAACEPGAAPVRGVAQPASRAPSYAALRPGVAR